MLGLILELLFEASASRIINTILWEGPSSKPLAEFTISYHERSEGKDSGPLSLRKG